LALFLFAKRNPFFRQSQYGRRTCVVEVDNVEVVGKVALIKQKAISESASEACFRYPVLLNLFWGLRNSLRSSIRKMFFQRYLRYSAQPNGEGNVKNQVNNDNDLALLCSPWNTGAPE